MWSVVIGQIFCKLKQSARTRMSCSAMRLEQDAIWCTQLTVGLLLLKRATRFLVSGPQMCSITNHRIVSPASSKSKLVILPVGFDLEITSSDISGGHLRQKTVGEHSDNSPIITPPTPWLDASTTPTKSGHPATSSRQWVGCFVDSLNIV
jgi:hypothetical protein